MPIYDHNEDLYVDQLVEAAKVIHQVVNIKK